MRGDWTKVDNSHARLGWRAFFINSEVSHQCSFDSDRITVPAPTSGTISCGQPLWLVRRRLQNRSFLRNRNIWNHLPQLGVIVVTSHGIPTWPDQWSTAMSHISTDTGWMSRGNCADRDPSIFFPSDGVGVERAKKLCEGCPSQSSCLEYALANRVEHGVWGGASERQRRRILKARRQVLLQESSVQVS